MNEQIEKRINWGKGIRILSWFMVLVAIFSVIMTFLATFYIFPTDLFLSAKTLLWVLLVTFGIWSLRNFLDARVFPVYRLHGIIFLLLTLVNAYLLTTQIF